LIEENTLAGIGAENSKGLYSSAGYFASIDTPAAKAFAEAYAAKFGTDAAALNSLGESCYEGVLLLSALAGKAQSLSASDIDAVAEGTTYEGPRGAATMLNRHVAKDIYLAEADGTAFKVVETFENVDPGNNCG
ncbi:MAG: transporter substrate-binding protein, partial [Alphaproteobacteria bacterium]|nr:transporter substrate-binding protein [Alphaproteobacteria bacterium]